MDFMPVFLKMIELFLIIIVGYIATKTGVFHSQIKAALSKIVLKITMPATILASVMMAESLPSKKQIGMLLFVSFLTYVVLFLLAKATSFLLRYKGKQKAVVEFGIMFSNVGFIGFPVTYAIFGASSTFYTSVFNMPFNLLCYSLGIYFIQSANRKKDNMENGGEGMTKKMLSLVLNPGLVAAILCLLLALFQYRGPKILGETCDIIGSITTPGALLIIGMALGEMPVKEMFNNIRAYLFTIISVLLTPLVMYVVFAPFVKSDALLLKETVIISAMPVATAGTMICVEYGGDEKLMAQITFLTTLASVVTIPLIAMFL